MRAVLLFWLWLLVAASSQGQPSAAVEAAPATDAAAAAGPVQPALHLPAADDGQLVAPVVLDGETLFRLRGVSAVPAERRAGIARDAIVRVAENPALDPTALSAEKQGDRYMVYVDGERVATLFPFDAAIEQVPLETLVEAVQMRLTEAIIDYRQARSPERLLRATAVLVGITLLGALLLYAVHLLFGWFSRLTEGAMKKRLEQVERASHRLIDASQLWGWLGGLVRGIRTLAIIAIVLSWINAALGLYPWTRPFARDVFQLILNPLQRIGTGIVEALPDLVFLVILAYIVRFILKATRTFFLRVDRGWIRLANFDRDWAMPTYRIVRILIVAFALVVAYPYIPGSDSDAFKGVSIFLGVVFSIGSSSFIANMIAGYSLTYRGAFREGDRVRIGEFVGDVINVRALSTQLRSLKNEEVNIPNSEVLAAAVVNYSTYAAEQGIILHPEVGIGYDTPWRQVEAMLLLAAGRTEGLQEEPAPFVLQTAMGDFAVTYQLNAFCRDATAAPKIYSALYAAIQDVFNEHGVQIMSPHYEGDPETPKVVPPDQWHAAPATGPAQG